MRCAKNKLGRIWLASFLTVAAAICLPFFLPLPANAQGSRQYIIVLDEPSLVEEMAGSDPDVPLPKKLRSLRAMEYDSYLAARQQQISQALERTAHLRVRGQVRTVLNALIAEVDSNDVARVRRLPGVRSVERSREYRLGLEAAIPLVRADQAWSSVLGGLSQAGRGIKIGILDTGIDISHPMFQDSSLTSPPGYPKGESSFTNSKVIVARNYVSMLSKPDVQNAQDRSGHGSFVAAVAAGNQASSPAGVLSGVAPKAFLGNYKIFGTARLNDTTNSGAIIAAINDAVQDGMDIINLSVGGLADVLPGSDTEVLAVNRAIQANVVVVIAAGNDGANAGCSGPCPSSITSPGIAPLAITAGATTNAASYRASLGATLPAPIPSTLQSIGYASGTGPTFNSTIGPLPITDTTSLGDSLACNPLPGGSLTGRMALIERGTCLFQTKVINATNAGARAVIVFNSATRPEEFVVMALLENTTIPAVFILRGDGLNLKGFVNTNSATAQVQITTQASVVSRAADITASFSSQGPNVDLTIKPDLVAPGLDIFSATETNYQQSPMFSSTGFLLSSGTSFSTPMVVGAAALVKQLHSNFTPEQVKSVLVSRANTQVSLSGTQGQLAGIQARGGGRLDVLAALSARASTTPVTISFGSITSGGSPIARQLTVQNFQSGAESYTISVETFPTSVTGASVSVDRTSLSIGAGSSDTVNVALQVSTLSTGFIEGQIHVVPAGGAELLVPFWGALNSAPLATTIAAADGDGQQGPAGSRLKDSLVARVTDQNGVPIPGVTIRWSSDSGGTVSPTSSVTNNLGLAASQATLGPGSGTQTFTAAAGTLSVSFTEQATTGTTFAISSISPSHGPPSGGTSVVISGSQFQSGAMVTFGTELAQVSSLTSTSITTVAPANNPGSVDVTVTNPGGQSVTSSSGFSYDTATSTQLSVSQGPLVFLAAQGDTRVQEQDVGITNLATGSVNWTASVAGSPPPSWLSILRASGSTPGTLQVRANPQGLAVGQYIGEVDVTAGGSTASVGVVLSVSSTAPSLFLAQVGDGQFANVIGQFHTSIVLINPNTSAANVTITFRDDTGAPLTLRLVSGRSGSSIPFVIPPRGTLFAETDGSTPALVVGSAEIQSNLPVGGAAIFLQRVANRPDFEAAVGLTLPQPIVVLPVDNTTGFGTGVAVVNGSDQAASLNLVFRDEQGVVRGSAAASLAARGHLSALASNLISATQGGRGTLTLQTTSGASIAAVSVRGQDSGALTTLPSVDNASQVASFTLPQVVEGPEPTSSGTVLFDTTWIFMNPGFVNASTTMRLRDDSGLPLSVTLTNGQTASDFPINLSARQASFLQTNSSATSLLIGHSLVSGDLPIAGVAIFRQRVPGRPDFEAGMGFSVPGQHFMLPFDNTPGFGSGVAVDSTGDSGVTVTFIARGEDGTQLASFTRQLPPRGHTAFLLKDSAPQTAGVRGSLELSTTSPVITAIGIRAFDTGPLTALPVVALAP